VTDTVTVVVTVLSMDADHDSVSELFPELAIEGEGDIVPVVDGVRLVDPDMETEPVDDTLHVEVYEEEVVGDCDTVPVNDCELDMVVETDGDMLGDPV
jgi:hypothetical protein